MAPAGVRAKLDEIGIIHVGTEYPEEGQVIPGHGPTKGIDLAFALHACFGLLWMLSAYFSICHAHKFHPKAHKYSGYVSAVAFAGHTFASAYTVYVDTVLHTALPKLVLLYTLVSSVAKVVSGITIARRRAAGWFEKHLDYMVDGYITSLAGAGPIRTIAHVQYWMGVGPSLCQNEYGGIASQCQVPYVGRLYWIGIFLAYLMGMYVKARNNKAMTRQYLRSTGLQLCVCAVVISLSWMSNAEKIVHQVFGEPRTLQNNIITVVGTVFIIADGVKYYRHAVAPSQETSKPKRQ